MVQPHTTHCLYSKITALLTQDSKSQEHGESSIAGKAFRRDDLKWILKKNKNQGILQVQQKRDHRAQVERAGMFEKWCEGDGAWDGLTGG